MKYKVIIEETVEALAEKVSDMMGDGWQLQAGVALVYVPDEPRQEIKGNLYYAQALIKP